MQGQNYPYDFVTKEEFANKVIEMNALQVRQYIKSLSGGKSG